MLWGCYNLTSKVGDEIVVNLIAITLVYSADEKEGTTTRKPLNRLVSILFSCWFLKNILMMLVSHIAQKGLDDNDLCLEGNFMVEFFHINKNN